MTNVCLNGTWTLQQVGAKLKLDASVPGDVYADLTRAKAIPDPYFRANELDLQWIGEADWAYSRDFEVAADLLGHDRITLVCDGLDTLATITVNGQVVARTDNMHRRWRFDVKPLLKVGRNRIEIRFASAAKYVTAKLAERRLPLWHQSGSLDGQNYIRKEPCNFGWDWGPCLVTAGIWRAIGLECWSVARLADLHVRQDHDPKNRQVALHIRAAIQPAAAVDLDAADGLDTPAVTGLASRITVTLNDVTVVTSHADVAKGTAVHPGLSIPDPQLWWPNGLGEQTLYTVVSELLDADGNVLCDPVTQRIGLRTLRLDRHADEWGECFQFVANGVPFFAKGANWIPANAILGNLTTADYERLIRDTAWANMNMLRVWGGGIYEDDRFYDLCDQYGICIWQDFMFACVTYPTYDPVFMANCRAEFVDNIQRLRHHASIALWCGNNELEMGLVADTWTDRAMSWEDYGRLFDQLLPEVVGSLDPDRDYWPCSPHSPVGERKDFNNPTNGDAHLWSVWHGQQPFEWYRTCTHRFNSEFGFQSFPEPRTVAAFTEPEDRNVTTWIMEHHQRSGIGNTTIMRYMLDWFRLPTGFDSTLWLSQILQGMAMKYACEHWRRSMPRGMGTLYWQLNDCWPAASWASIDHLGRFKALHFMARHFFAPVLVSGLEDPKTGTVEVHVTSDRLDTVDGIVNWRLTQADGTEIDSGSKKHKARPTSTKVALTLKLAKHLATADGGVGARDLMLWLDFTVGDEVLSTNFVTFARPKHLGLRAPRITRRVAVIPGGGFRVTLTARHPALWTWLSLPDTDATYSDNFVHLIPGKATVIDVFPAKRMTAESLRDKLLVQSLHDTYQETK